MNTSLLLLTCLCSPGEKLLRNCTETASSVCWPCDAGSHCLDGIQTPCPVNQWSTVGSTTCRTCAQHCPGQLELLPCAKDRDAVCVPCPKGMGCVDGHAELCPMGSYSNDSSCVRCPENTTTIAEGASSAEHCIPGCSAPLVLVNGHCLHCPDGFGCADQKAAIPCKPGTFSNQGHCVPCPPHSNSNAQASECFCEPGYVDRPCTGCKPGTVWSNGSCVSCSPGRYCVGLTHSDVCPIDTWSKAGAAMCNDCPSFSGCIKPPCTDVANCTCDEGYIQSSTSCVRCPAGTHKVDPEHCGPCPPGFECSGGPDVLACGLGFFSPGNQSACNACSDCRELTAARCNATHDSVCERTTLPLVVARIEQEFKTSIDPDRFGTFAAVYSASLPRGRLMSVCDGAGHCVKCFQGLCPKLSRLEAGTYKVRLEVRLDHGLV